MEQDSILLLSGGIDSTTLLADLRSRGKRPFCLIFQYGQTLWREVPLAEDNARHFGCNYYTINAPLNWLPANCSILKVHDFDIATGRTLEEIEAGGTPGSYVPFRNGIFLAYAVALGESLGIEEIYCGGNGLNSGNYWDDTLEFGQAFQAAAREGTDPGYNPSILYPYANMTKSQIVQIGLGVGLDYKRTWSCYKRGPEHCGFCDSCIQRGAAFAPYNLSLKGELPTCMLTSYRCRRGLFTK